MVKLFPWLEYLGAFGFSVFDFLICDITDPFKSMGVNPIASISLFPASMVQVLR